MMSDWTIIGIIVVIAIVVALGYWQLVAAEGAYLGQRMVALLYDWFAPRYDHVKAFDPAFEAIFLAQPVLKHNPNSRVLDVAAGTGRVAQALLNQPNFGGHVTCLDLSSRMLDVARANLSGFAGRVTFELGTASPLQHANDGFDVVCCLEALEFLPNPSRALMEIKRVLKPGGLLLISNRIGRGARALPGRTQSTVMFCDQLRALGFADVQFEAWLVDYDLVVALKT